MAELKVLFGTSPLPAHTPRTISTVADLARVCAQIRAKGFAVDDGEDVEELRCLAAPIRDEKGTIVASIGISAPVTRFPASRYAPTARTVSDAAKKISASLHV